MAFCGRVAVAARVILMIAHRNYFTAFRERKATFARLARLGLGWVVSDTNPDTILIAGWPLGVVRFRGSLILHGIGAGDL
jgi:hypothetical protein